MPKKAETAQKIKRPKQVVGKEDLIREREDIEGLRVHLEEEYRKANISEKNYQELKGKYEKKLKEIEEQIGKQAKPEKKKVSDKKKEEKIEKEVETEVKKPESKTVEPAEKAVEPTVVEPAVEPVAPVEVEEPVEAKEEPKVEGKKVGLGFFNKITGLFDGLFSRVSKPKKPKKPKAAKPSESELGQKYLAKGAKEEKSEEEKLIEQAALAVGSVQEGAASMIEGAEEKMAQLREEGPTVEEPAAAETVAAPAAAGVAERAAEAEGAAAAPVVAVGGAGAVGMELEKLKVMIDGIRETKRATDETLQTLAESIGEIRSMVFQTDGAVREVTAKMDKIEDEIGEIKPDKITKKFGGISTTMEKQQLLLEKLSRKSEDLAEKINKVYDMLKGAGGIENLVNINNNIQKKIKNINDIIKYIERIAFKTEKSYIDLNKRMEEFTIYKTKQDGLEESVKDLIKSVDKLNLELENYSKKIDLTELREDILVLQKEVGEITKALPVLQAKLPEPIRVLKREREDILLFLENLEESFKSKSISKEEFDEVVKKNKEKLAKINQALKKEWGRLEEYAKIVDVEEAGVEVLAREEEPAGEEVAVGEEAVAGEEAAVSEETKPEEEVEKAEAEAETVETEVEKVEAEEQPPEKPPSEEEKEKVKEVEEVEKKEEAVEEAVEEPVKPKKKKKRRKKKERKETKETEEIEKVEEVVEEEKSKKEEAGEKESEKEEIEEKETVSPLFSRIRSKMKE